MIRKSTKKEKQPHSTPQHLLHFSSLLLSILIGILLCIFVWAFWWYLERQEESSHANKISFEAEKIMSYIQGDLRGRIPSFNRIAKRWESRGGTPRGEFFDDAAHYIADMPGLQAIEWVDKNYVIQWVIPEEGNEEVAGVDFSFETNRQEAIKQAKNNRIPTMSNPIELLQGGKGFLVLCPIYVDGKFDGFVLSVFRTTDWLKYVLTLNETPREFEEFRIALSIEDTMMYSQTDWSILDSSYQHMTHATILNKRFAISVRPTEQFFERNNTITSRLVAILGSILSVLVAVTLFFYQKGTVATWTISNTKIELEKEIEERIQTEESLKDLSNRLTLATKAGGIGVWSWRVENNFLDWDDRMFEIYDVPSDVKPRFDTWRRAVHPDDLPGAEKMLNDAIEGTRTFDTEFRVVHSDGSVRYIRAAARIERDRNQKPRRVTGVNWDITDQKLAEERIQYLANHDTLTGLPSLRLARDRIEVGVASAKRYDKKVAVLFIDLDGFKSMNDTYGHDAGDALLQQVAQRLESCIRDSDTAARIGGDEFLVILEDVGNADNAKNIAEKVLELVVQPIPYLQNELRVGASIGIALYPDHGKSGEELINKADEAMYHIKKGGKNGVFLSNEER